MSYDQHLGEIAKIYENSTPQLEEEINIFKILNLEYDEVRLHSRILKFLIERDPSGFIESIPKQYWDEIGKPVGRLPYELTKLKTLTSLSFDYNPMTPSIQKKCKALLPGAEISF